MIHIVNGTGKQSSHDLQISEDCLQPEEKTAVEMLIEFDQIIYTLA